MESITLFGPGLGGPSNHYRIPSIITTDSGTVVACADARYAGGYDNPNRIDKVVRRSTDGGKTWGSFIVAVSEQGTSLHGSSAAIDPVMVYVSSMNRIYMLYCHTPAGIGLRNSVPMTGEDRDGNPYITRGSKVYLKKGEALYTPSGDPTPYRVTAGGDVYLGAARLGNIRTRDSFAEAPTSFLMICHSDDEGRTWSTPYSLNSQVKEESMGFIGPGPGIGLVKRYEPHAGRIIVPIYYGTQGSPLPLFCCVIYSDDGGQTWTRGESPCEKLRPDQTLTESQVIEQEDGTLKVFMRNHDDCRRVAVAYSRDGGASWCDFSFVDALPQPICQLSVLKLKPQGGQPLVAFLNAADPQERKNGVLRLSEDDGETFRYSRVLTEGEFVYSCMTQLPDGRIGILYEPTNAATHIAFTAVDVDWIRQA